MEIVANGMAHNDSGGEVHAEGKIMDNILTIAEELIRGASLVKILGLYFMAAVGMSVVVIAILSVAAIKDNPVEEAPVPKPITARTPSKALEDLKNFSIESSPENEALDELHREVQEDLELRQRGKERIGGIRAKSS